MKKLIALAAALLAMLVLACACSSGTVDRTNQPVPQEAEETFIPVPTDWIVESLEGALWEDDRASLKVVREDEGYKVIIEWGSSAWESSVWIYSCTRDAEAHTLNAVRTMCEGELKQLANANRQLDKANYLDIIGCKTASLIATCCELGACHIGCTAVSPFREALRNYGYNYGIVFQIRDDMHDTDSRHDATLLGTIDPLQLIDRHTQLAIEALSSLPDTPARQSFCSLLLPDAPQPTNQSL